MNMLILLIGFLLCAPLALAQGTMPRSQEPIEITADGTLEWKRAEQLFIAHGNARAVQGTTDIAAETLSAAYRGGEDGVALDIYKLTALENVVITSGENKVFGARGIYDVDQGLAVLTGGDLRMISPQQKVTARERFEYHASEGKIIAKGKARVERKNPKGHVDILEADTLIARLSQNPQGKQSLSRMEAEGSVVITTPDEILRGQRGFYDATRNIAEISGGVTITRGPNILEGERAEVDLTTNTSRMFAAQGITGTTPSGRVRGVFYPGSEKKSP